MSKKKHQNALLKQYDGPFFPPAIYELNDRLIQLVIENLCTDEIRSRCRRMPYYKTVAGEIMGLDLRMETTDGYRWFATVCFEKGLFRKRQVLVAIPSARDHNKTDGSEFDRSAAVYTFGNPKIEFIDQVVRSVLNAFQIAN